MSIVGQGPGFPSKNRLVEFHGKRPKLLTSSYNLGDQRALKAKTRVRTYNRKNDKRYRLSLTNNSRDCAPLGYNLGHVPNRTEGFVSFKGSGSVTSKVGQSLTPLPKSNEKYHKRFATIGVSTDEY